MYFTYEELARLNTMIGTALMSGKVEFDEISGSVHKKVTEELRRVSKDSRCSDGLLAGAEKEVR